MIVFIITLLMWSNDIHINHKFFHLHRYQRQHVLPQPVIFPLEDRRHTGQTEKITFIAALDDESHPFLNEPINFAKTGCGMLSYHVFSRIVSLKNIAILWSQKAILKLIKRDVFSSNARMNSLIIWITETF